MALKRLRLAQRRKAMGLTQEGLAGMFGVERSTVVRWESAETEPQAWLWPKLAAALKITPEKLAELMADIVELPAERGGLVLVSTVPLDFSISTAHTLKVMEGFSAHDIASRRNVLAQFSVLSGAALLAPVRQWVAALPLPPVNEPGLGTDEAAELEQAVQLFCLWDASGLGGLHRKAVAGQFHAVAERLRDHHAPEIKQRLFLIAAKLASLAGWMSYDQGMYGIAQRYWLLGLHACREAAAPAVGAKIIGDMSMIPAQQGRHEDSLNLIHSALYSLPRDKSSTLVRSELLGREANAYARLGGETSNAVRAAETGVEVWSEGPKESTPDGFFDYLHQQRGEVLAATAYIDLALQDPAHTRRRHYAELAERHVQAVRAGRPQEYTRSRILDEIKLAQVRVAQAEPTEAAKVAQGSLKLAENTRSSLVVDKLLRLNGALASRYTDAAEVDSFQGQLRDYVSKAAPAREAELVGVH
jgi:transcriptional regulator with XRE-family HTH domain